MIGPIQVTTRKPEDCNETDIDDFVALVLAGGEVKPKGLKTRIRCRAVSLAFLTMCCCLCGVAGLKRPHAVYRSKVSSKSKVPLPEDQFPYELGWVFVMPSARGRRLSVDLVREALSGAVDQGVFATTRIDNHAMQRTLERLGFVSAGAAWPSERVAQNDDPYELRLLLRHAKKSAVSGEELRPPNQSYAGQGEA
jgi:RimJ/RimL family protein N-acetyltransferase